MSSSSGILNDNTGPRGPAAGADNRSVSKMWFGLSIASLLLAGFMSLSFIAGRAPGISRWITDPLWIKRVLVVHVNLALIVFIYSFFCGLYVLKHPGFRRPGLQFLGFRLGVISTLILVSTVFFGSAAPVLSNYVPVLEHPVFMAGLFLFGLALIISLAGSGFSVIHPSSEAKETGLIAPESRPPLNAAAILLVLAVAVFVISWFLTDKNLSSFMYYELVMWGGGHILQFVNASLTIAVWLILVRRLTGRAGAGLKVSAVLSAVFVFPVLFSPLLLLKGTSSFLYLSGFTMYMKWGLFPVMSVFMVMIIRQMSAGPAGGGKPMADPYFTGLLTSLLFMLVGFLVGFVIRGSNTLIPAHYHAALGSITIAFMTLTYYLLEVFGHPFSDTKTRKIAALQPLVFGAGMLLFVAGFAYAGANGLARKTFGAEQILANKGALIGIGTAGIGGLLAVTGGVLFLIVILKNFRAKKH